MYDPASIPAGPVFLKDPPGDAGLLNRLRAEETAGGGGFDAKPAGPRDEAYWQALRARYWGMVTLVDKAVGCMLDALAEAGVADRTIVVFSSEHGDQLGDHNIIQKAVFYEQSIRVPMLVRVPWLGDEERRITGRYGHIDTVPTLLDLVDAEVPSHLQGTSRAAVLRGEETLEANDVVIDWTGRNIDPSPRFPEVERVQNVPHRILISHDGWKLTLGERSQGELYDLNSDPYEETNLYGDPAQRSRIGEMAARIREWQRRTGDTAPLPGV